MPVSPTAKHLSKKTPRPTRERRAGQRTDLVSPTPTQDDARERWCVALSLLAQVSS
jgi:hypothetical protein